MAHFSVVNKGILSTRNFKSLTFVLEPKPGCSVVTKQFCFVNVTPHHANAAMASLTHDATFGSAIPCRLRRQAGSQGMRSKARRLETHTLTGTLYDKRHDLRCDGPVSDPAVAIYVSEQRTGRDAGNLQPGAILPRWTGLWMGAIRDTNRSTSTFLVGLTVTQQHLQTIACILNIFDGQGGQFAAPEAPAKAKQQQSGIAGTDGILRQAVDYVP